MTHDLQTLGLLASAAVVGFTCLMAWGAAKFNGDVF